MSVRQRSNKDDPLSPIDHSSDINELREKLDYKDLDQSIKYRNKEVDLMWKKSYYELRIIWATLSLVLLGFSLWFTFWLVEGVGTGRLNFIEYKTFLGIIASEIIINVLGLVAIVMHFLFPSSGSKKPD